MSESADLLKARKKAACSRCGSFYHGVSASEWISNSAGQPQSDFELTQLEDLEDLCLTCLEMQLEETELPVNAANFSSSRFFHWFFGRLFQMKSLLLISGQTFGMAMVLLIALILGIIFVRITAESLIDSLPANLNAVAWIELTIACILLSTTLIFEAAFIVVRAFIPRLVDFQCYGEHSYASFFARIKQHTLLNSLLLCASLFIFFTQWLSLEFSQSSVAEFVAGAVSIVTLSLTEFLVFGLAIPSFVVHQNVDLSRFLREVTQVVKVWWLWPVTLFFQCLCLAGVAAVLAPGILVSGLLLFFHLAFYLAFFHGRAPCEMLTWKADQCRRDYVRFIARIN